MHGRDLPPEVPGAGPGRPLEQAFAMIVPDRPTEAEIAAAVWRPDSYLPRIVRSLDPEGEVPREAVIGMWRVDGRGRIVGGFIVNPDYDPVRWPDDSVEDVVTDGAWPGLQRLLRWMARLFESDPNRPG